MITQLISSILLPCNPCVVKWLAEVVVAVASSSTLMAAISPTRNRAASSASVRADVAGPSLDHPSLALFPIHPPTAPPPFKSPGGAMIVSWNINSLRAFVSQLAFAKKTLASYLTTTFPDASIFCFQVNAERDQNRTIVVQ